MNPQTHIGIKTRGRLEYLKHLEGKRLTRGQAVLAKCYECMGGFKDGKVSCRVPGCPLFPWMPYKNEVQTDT